jgi:hypothetical protein
MRWHWYWKSWDKCEDLIQSSWRLTQLILLIGTVLPLALVVWKLHGASPQPERTTVVVSPISQSTETPVIGVTDANLPVRTLLPYSVIPGGAENGVELRSAIAHDPVVAGHYVLFDLAKTRVIHLDRDRAMYVSYRMGNYVYWTKRKLVIPKGEALLTDGQYLARTRCGNRLSDTAEVPTSLHEPERALESPPPDLVASSLPPPELPVSPIGPLGPPPEAPPGGHIFFPPIIPIFWGSGTPPITPATPPPPSGPPHFGPPPPPKIPHGPPGGPGTPPTSIPEPSTVLLLFAGIAAFATSARSLRKNMRP